jgi:hypothetical protein
LLVAERRKAAEAGVIRERARRAERRGFMLRIQRSL